MNKQNRNWLVMVLVIVSAIMMAVLLRITCGNARKLERDEVNAQWIQYLDSSNIKWRSKDVLHR